MVKALQKLLVTWGAKPIEKPMLDDYMREMREKVIPGIRESEKERLRLAAESRFAPETRKKRKI